MNRKIGCLGITRRSMLTAVAALPVLSNPLIRTSARAQDADPLPSWNNGRAKQSIIAFVQATTDASSSKLIPQEARIATFDGWHLHPGALRGG